eukprot:comp39485_c0_seq1/m.47380 comp39485_c0_seq1/g.47380  ORF comp39485_c0_seq1/g.47380 comp39485_c0_seq1/m.47380 type:complete len:384 (-) comp39485_c0_seq1:126-1277(-)
MEALKKSGLLALPLCMVFVTTGVFVNTMQLVLYACVGWWNHNLFRTINAQLVTLNWSLFVWLADWYAGLKLRLFGDPKAWEMVGKDRALCLVNHTSDIDWLMGWMIAERFHMLGGTKAFMKESAKYYPILGWTWHFCEFIWLKRSWDSDKKTIDSGLRQLQDYPLPYWAVLFPEGTRWTPKKHLASQQFSREKGLPVLEHLLTPRPKGFVFAVKCLRQDIDAMYICTFAFKDKKAPTMLSILKGESTEVHAYCQKFDPKSLPEDDKGLTEWLNAHFIEMDILLTYHDQHHIYPGPETFQNVTNRPMYITMFWFVVHALFLVWWIYSSIVTGNYAGLQRLGIFTLATAVILGILLKVSAADKTKVAKPVDGKGTAASKEEKKEK